MNITDVRDPLQSPPAGPMPVKCENPTGGILNAYIASQLHCPSCGWIMFNITQARCRCDNPTCRLRGSQFLRPTLPLVVVPPDKEDTD